MKQLVLIFAILGLAACGHSSSNTADGGGNKGGNEALQKATTADQCQSGVPAHQLQGSWATVFTSPHLVLDMTFEFKSNGTLRLANKCSTPNGNLTAVVSAYYQDDGVNMTIANRATDTEKGGGMTCSASLDQGQTRYTFEGSCLVMIDAKGEKLYLTRAN